VFCSKVHLIIFDTFEAFVEYVQWYFPDQTNCRGLEFNIVPFVIYSKCIIALVILESMGEWIYELANEDQLRWIGPEKGVIALATAAIVNAFWDLWGKMEKKPVWKLLADMTPEKIASLIDFR
jgi:L-fuconate dehydratase